MADFCAELRQGLGELFSCAQSGTLRRIISPFLYPDGDSIDLFVEACDGIITVSDMGETMRWMRTQLPPSRMADKLDAMIEDICITHGVDLRRSTLVTRCRHDDDLADAAIRVAQAAVRVSGLWYVLKP